MLIVMSLLFGLGIFSFILFFQNIFLSKKIMAKIINYSVGRGNYQDIGSFSRGYRYSFLIDDEIYNMPKYFYYGFKLPLSTSIKDWLRDRGFLRTPSILGSP